MSQKFTQEEENRAWILARTPPGKILLVEDNLVNQKLTASLLQKAGLKVTVAGNGQEAVEFVRKENFDFVLMDIQMPVMDGIAACREIRNSHPQLPIIAMTAESLIYDQEQCFDAGMNDYLQKPIDIAELYAKICRWLNLYPLKK